MSTLKLFNQGQRTINHASGVLKPGELAELPQAEALYLKKLYKRELLDMNDATKPLQGEAKKPEPKPEVDERTVSDRVRKAKEKEAKAAEKAEKDGESADKEKEAKAAEKAEKDGESADKEKEAKAAEKAEKDGESADKEKEETDKPAPQPQPLPKAK